MNNDELMKKVNEFVDRISPKQDRKVLTQDQFDFIKTKLGYSGIMLSSSKRAKVTKGGEHLSVFNANLIVEGYNKVWFGDIDVTDYEERLKEISRVLKAKVYVLTEMDARFENENKPQIQNAVYETDGTDGVIRNQHYVSYYERGLKGKFYRRRKCKFYRRGK